MEMTLGRHQEHDPASRNYPAAMATHLHDVSWTYHGAVLDQGEVGSCTGNAAVEVLMTGPYYDHLQHVYTEDDALKVYERATQIDRIPGRYPPTDTGSSGLAVMKACREFAWITAYHHCFSLDAALRALMLGPVITGVVWYESMFKPDSDGTVHIAGSIAGGHEFTVLGYDSKREAVRCLNHWTPQWGDGGYFWLKAADWNTLLHQHGDVTVPVT